MRVLPDCRRCDRHPAQTYEEILALDSRPVPDYLREQHVPDIGTDPIQASRYFDADFFRDEARYVWSRVWQMACREEDIPKVNDCFIYEILGKSLIVTRSSAGEIRAFYNTCLHRGRKLVVHGGNKSEFRCPYHGFSWNCDGSFKYNPIGWDFPQWEGRNLSLPQAKVAVWAGYVFINFDPEAPPLEQFIAPMARDFARFDHSNRYRTAWVQKKIRANWKVTAEAFMESHHSFGQHPQILPGIADVNSQYDLPSDFVSRHFSALGVSSPMLPPMTEQAIYGYLTHRADPLRRSGDSIVPPLPDGRSARSFFAELRRKELGERTGRDLSAVTDAELIDALVYNLFPNLGVLATYAPNIVYQWRPNGLDPESTVMDIMILAPIPNGEVAPKPMPLRVLDFDEKFSTLGDLGGLSLVFDQDVGNLAYVQEGLKASGNGLVHFAKYSEMRIRHFHKTIDRLIAEGRALSAASNV